MVAKDLGLPLDSVTSILRWGFLAYLSNDFVISISQSDATQQARKFSRFVDPTAKKPLI